MVVTSLTVVTVKRKFFPMLTPQPCSKQPAMSQVNTHANIHTTPPHGAIVTNDVTPHVHIHSIEGKKKYHKRLIKPDVWLLHSGPKLFHSNN